MTDTEHASRAAGLEDEGAKVAKTALPRGFAKSRVIDAALKLFAEHGVNGTSLQMIADELGVRKASVYYQFPSKDEIVLAVVEPVFEDLKRLVKIAEAVDSEVSRREVAISGLVELAVRHRQVTAVFYMDPAVDALVHSTAEFIEVTDRLATMLTGDQPDMATRVTVTMITAGIYGTATHPELTDVPDDELHRILLQCAQQLLRSVAADL